MFLFKFFGSILTLVLYSVAANAAMTNDVIIIGHITDMSGPYADLDGKGGDVAIQLAIDDIGGEVNGNKVQLISADHQNKADIAAATARKWYDKDGVALIIGGTNSATTLAMAEIAEDKRQVFISAATGSTDITNDRCNPYTIHYTYSNRGQAGTLGKAVVDAGGKSWYFITADYSFGHSLEKETSRVVLESGGEVVGGVRVPIGTTDFASFVLQAPTSEADIVAFANAGTDFINAVKNAVEFGLTKTMQPVGLNAFIIDVKALGLDTLRGMYLGLPWYWTMSDETIKWSERFERKMGRKPGADHAGIYSAALHYLKAVKATKSDDPDTVLKWMRNNPVNDMFAKNAIIRADGRLMNDMYLLRVKDKVGDGGPWDLVDYVARIPAEEAFGPLSESTCYLVDGSNN